MAYRGWFDLPRLTRPRPLVFHPHRGGAGPTLFSGHLALSGQRHLDHPTFTIDAADRDEFECFHTAWLECVDADVQVGPVTAAHASTDPPLTLAAAAEWSRVHAIGWARVGHDQHGIVTAGYLAGRVHPPLSLSGDWRDDGTGWRLVGVSLTADPGLPVPGWTTPLG